MVKIPSKIEKAKDSEVETFQDDDECDDDDFDDEDDVDDDADGIEEGCYHMMPRKSSCRHMMAEPQVRKTMFCPKLEQ